MKLESSTQLQRLRNRLKVRNQRKTHDAPVIAAVPGEASAVFEEKGIRHLGIFYRSQMPDDYLYGN